MVNSIIEFANKIENFDNFQASEKIDYFSYYVTIFLKKEKFSAKDIQLCFDEYKIPQYSNVPQYLSNNSKKTKAKIQKFIKKDNFYILTKTRENEIKSTVILDKPKITVEKNLRDLIVKITNQSEKDFLSEAIKTFEIEAYRASILMVWLLTIDHLYEYVLQYKLSDFISALRRMNNNKSIVTKDDFGEIKESIFIEACRGANIISNDIRKILDTKLGIRNSFAHPSTITLPKSKALEFIEDLIENVILKY
jgi:hypothetical protein